jgi:ATP-dependent helicase/nuclease subunit A
MSIANTEQLEAIEHRGGVLLSAGAGSGKTFVLIQHMLYLGDRELVRTQGQAFESRVLEMKKFFSSVVLMTFTKKATGELKIRLRKIINEIERTSEEKKLLTEGFSMINVSTIHGFCSTLISLGYINGTSSTIRVISDTEFQEKMDVLFEEWLVEVLKDDSLLSVWQKNVLFSNTNEIQKSINMVFSTPELRVKWENISGEENLDYKTFIADYMSLINIVDPKSALNLVHLPTDPSLTKQKWYEFLMNFKEIADNNPLDSVASLEAYKKYFDAISRLTGPKSSLGLTSVNDFFDWMKEFRDFLRGGFLESLSTYEAHKNGAYKEWHELFHKVFKYISRKYESIPGLTFSDLEFYVFKSLQEVETRRLVSSHFKYFVVDEFQDTSAIQYEIIRSCINSDLRRLFCVGDVKQAIYGFRGGELGVFENCSKQIPQKLSLLNNYRSRPLIVNFNNLIFENLFHKGLAFEGKDNHSVEVEKQCLPETKTFEDVGTIKKIDIVLRSNEEKWRPSSDEISLYESMGLYELIKSIRSESSDLICVLYKNLKPSKHLISILTRADIPFRAQVKLSIKEEPVICLFGFCLSYKDSNDSELVGIKHFEKYLELLECTVESPQQILHDFINDELLYGLIPAYEKLLFTIGIANSGWSHNVNTLAALVDSIGSDASKISASFEMLESEKISLDFYYGDSVPEVLIMTAHSSKGLQFSHVLIGGIHNNGRYISNNDFFGKIPGSFKWKLDRQQKTPFKSPYYLFENALDKRKDFSESKRLFYVAATRAENTLGFVDLRLQDNTPVYSDKNSWICGLRSALDDLSGQLDISILEYDFNIDDDSFNGSEVDAPAFHRDTLGVTSIPGDECGVALVTIPDLSVTGISTLALCPRKFYLSQICKIQFDTIRSMEEIEVADQNTTAITSSAERGTNLHEVLAHAFTHNFVINLSSLSELTKQDQTSVNFALQYIKDTYGLNAIYSAEKVMKFSLFGHMVSGTADLVIEGDHNAIIDFKTGKKPFESDHYWSQLLSYAFALGQINDWNDHHKIDLCLLYIDEQKVESKNFSMGDVRDQVFSLWLKTKRLDVTESVALRLVFLWKFMPVEVGKCC